VHRATAPDPLRWRDCTPYLHGIDLYNHGFYWEAHEAWESVWHACGRTGPTADLLRALIRLAAAGFKVRAGRPNGRVRHAQAAAAAFEALAAARPGRFLGLDPAALACEARAIAEGSADAIAVRGDDGPVFVRPLVPED
jgi:predicted metal-dependent hydrolase